MADNYKVGVEVTADSKEAEKGLKNVEKSVDNLDKTTKKANKSSDDLNKKLTNLGKGFQTFGKNMSLYVTGPIAGFAALAVKEFINAEKELNQLNLALQNSGNYSKAAVEQFKNLADELERTTNFSGGTVMMASAMALNFTKTTAEAERLVRAATDLSEATGTSLDSAIKNLGGSLGGMTGQLSQLVPELRSLTQEQLKAGAAIDIIEKRFSGSALNATKNLSGEITRLKNGFLAFASDIGSQLAPYLRELVSQLNNALTYVRNLDPVVRNTAIGIGLLVAAIGPLSIALGTMITLLPIITAGFTALTAVITGPVGIVVGVVALATAFAGVVNVIYTLQKITGSWADAFVIAGSVALNGFLRVFIAPFLNWIDIAYSAMSKIPGLNQVYDWEGNAQQFRNWRTEILDGFKNSKETLKNTFEEGGVDLGDTFTLGLLSSFSDLKDRITKAITLPVSEGLESVNKEITTTSEKAKEEINQYAQAISGNFANSFSSIIDGTKSVGQAFSDMAQSIVQDLTRMIIQQAAYNAIAGLLPGGASTGVATGGYVNGGQITHRYAKGGMVRGPGTGTSDSIPARLSNGEFVSDAKTVSHFGADFFLNLKHMARSFQSPSPILNRTPGFANGGLVGGAGAGETRVVIQNSGSPKEATSVTTEQDAQGMVVNVILEDIQKNGNISKSLQTNYGLKRGGL